MNVQFTEFTKRNNSTARPGSYAKTVSCQIKQPCNVRTPVLILKASSYSASWNYAYISKWGYYYFVSDVTFTTGDRCEVSLSVDVMASYKTAISNYTCFVERSASNYDAMITDAYLSNSTVINKSNITVNNLVGGFDSVVGFFVIRTVCGNGGVTGIRSYAVTQNQLADVLSFMFNDGNFTDVITDESVKTFFNPFQYIVEIKWIPYDYSKLSTLVQEKVQFGWWTSDTTAIVLSSLAGVTFYCDSISIPANSYTDWRKNSDRFSSYNIYLPAVGTIQLSAQELYEGLCCKYELDIASGECLVSLYSGKMTNGESPTGVLISSYKTTMATPVQIGQLNSTAAKTASNVGSVVGDLLTFQWGRAISTAVDTATTAMQPTPSVNGMTGERYIIARERNILVSLNNLTSCEYATSVAGRPCFKNLRLGTLSGYVKCGNASIPLNGYDADIEAVNAYLNGGFYME